MIGIFDSGIGGLTVVKELLRQLPQYQILYFGDTARLPYGTKGQETITKFGLEDAAFLESYGAHVIVIACNTASAVAASAIRAASKVSVFDVIVPAVEKAAQVTKNKRIGVIGTYATVNSGVYERLLKEKHPDMKVLGQAAPLLVPLVEEGWLKRPETKRILKYYVRPLLQQGVDTLILGCTHYPFLKSMLQQYVGRRVKLVDPAEEVAKELAQYIKDHPELEATLKKGSSHQFFLSDVTPRFQGIAEKWLGMKITIEKASL